MQQDMEIRARGAGLDPPWSVALAGQAGAVWGQPQCPPRAPWPLSHSISALSPGPAPSPQSCWALANLGQAWDQGEETDGQQGFPRASEMVNFIHPGIQGVLSSWNSADTHPWVMGEQRLRPWSCPGARPWSRAAHPGCSHLGKGWGCSVSRWRRNCSPPGCESIGLIISTGKICWDTAGGGHPPPAPREVSQEHPGPLENPS